MIDRTWVMNQIADKYGDTGSQIGPCLFQMFDRLYALPDDQRAAAIDEFTALLHGLALLPDEVYRPRLWMPAKDYHGLSDVGRVRPDLMLHEGWLLNGRVGRIIAKRRGDIIIKFDKHVVGGLDEYRGVVTDFEVDISHLDTPQKGYHQKS
jgi:hypothetical protein